MNGTQLSAELRRGRGTFIEKRREVVALSLLATGAMGLVTLYQMGLIKHLPEPPLPYLDADEVDAAGEAYGLMNAPDGALGVRSYATTLALAAVGGLDRAKEKPWLPLALAAKVGFDALVAGKLTVDQWKNHRAFCLYCLVAAGASVAMLPKVAPEAKAALAQLRAHPRQTARKLTEAPREALSLR